jgi:hypothetical protein
MDHYHRRQLLDRDMVNIMNLLSDNYTQLWDLLNCENEHLFSSADVYMRLRTRIFDALRRHVDVAIVDFWSGSNEKQELLMGGILSAAQTTDWPHGSREWDFRRHRHHSLLNDWGLVFPFQSTSHKCETHGVPWTLIRIVDRAAEAQLLLDAWMSKDPPPLEPPQSSYEYSTLDLIFSPTARAMRGPEQALSQTYHNAAHGRQLRKPTPLAGISDTSTGVEDLNAIRVYLGAARDALRAGCSSSFLVNVNGAIRQNRANSMDQLLRSYADLPAALGLLGRLKGGAAKDMFSPGEGDGDVDGNGCPFCKYVAWANTLMLRQRLVPATEDEVERAKTVLRQFFSHHYGLTEGEAPTEPLTITSLSFEHRIRYIAREISVIINPGARHR